MHVKMQYHKLLRKFAIFVSIELLDQDFELRWSVNFYRECHHDSG